jgi:hypothetical protein
MAMAQVFRGEHPKQRRRAMAREDWQDREDERRRAATRDRDDYGPADYSRDHAYDGRRRAGYRVDEAADSRGDDYGQADYSTDYAYDPERRSAYRRYSADDRDYMRRMNDGDDVASQPRSWNERADPRAHRRHGPSDRVLWAVISERLEDARGLDLRDVDLRVEDAEVTLNGTVRQKADKRRIEDIADIDGVRHVQNNLRVHERGHWTFF